MKLSDADLLALLPPHIAEDPAFKSAGEAVAPHLRAIVRAIPNLLIFARLGGQDTARMLPPLRRLTEARGGLRAPETALLEALAWQFHVDFREAATTDAQLAAMVRNSIPWHRIKGTPASIKAALALFGYRAAIEEDGTGDLWATWQLGLPELADMDTVRHIVAICNEMQPARCKLWRVYTDIYDWRPGVWSGGRPMHVWSGFWWSWYSGVPVSDIPGVDEAHPLVVSFGTLHRYQAEQSGHEGGGLGIAERTGILAPYIDCPVWSRSSWSDVFPRNHGFTLGELYSLHWCVRTTITWPWSGAWDGRPWMQYSTWDRELPLWRIRHRSASRVQQVWSWPGDGLEPGNPVALHGDGTWGDINAAYGLPTAVIFRGACWGDPWGHDPQRQELVLHERFIVRHTAQSTEAGPGIPRAAGALLLAGGTTPLRERGWRGAWGGRRWLSDVFSVGMGENMALAMRADGFEERPRMAGREAVAMPVEPRASEAPRLAGLEQTGVTAAPAWRQEWSGPYAGRTWNNLAQTIIRSETL